MRHSKRDSERAATSLNNTGRRTWRREREWSKIKKYLSFDCSSHPFLTNKCHTKESINVDSQKSCQFQGNLLSHKSYLSNEWVIIFETQYVRAESTHKYFIFTKPKFSYRNPEKLFTHLHKNLMAITVGRCLSVIKKNVVCINRCRMHKRRWRTVDRNK